MASTPITFEDGLEKIGENWSALSDSQKIDLFKSTSVQEASVRDLAKICPFRAHMYYEE